MEFSIEVYEISPEKCPKRDFLNKLKQSNPGNFPVLMAGLCSLRSRNYHRPTLSNPVDDDFFELRHIGKLNTRVLYFFMKGQGIILVHVNKKKMRVLLAHNRGIGLRGIQHKGKNKL